MIAIETLAWEKVDNLIPAIIQDAKTLLGFYFLNRR